MVKYKEILDEVHSLNSNVELVSVSKTKPFSSVLEAYDEGARVFGENRVQEIETKFPNDKPNDMKIYLIGHLQTNKVKKAVSLVNRIESVDSLRLLKLIESECEKQNKRLEILLEVNSSGEENKSGFRDIDQLFQTAEYAYNAPMIDFKGLMTVGPLGFDMEKNKKSFSFTKDIFDNLKKRYGISVLSMGMSADWREAIACGSTEVRIGSAIFGERN